ncbi:hypothetical protein MBLNU459_g6300t1 [Dothideomycetes sp. NU459]
MSSPTGGSNNRDVHTYHCLCTQLVLASTTPLDKLATRSSDKSYICATPEGNADSHHASMLNTSIDSKPTVIRREDGFEKRYFHRCARCDLMVAYQLDKSHYEGEAGHGANDTVVYLLPGGLQTTEDMKDGKSMEAEVGRAGVKT